MRIREMKILRVVISLFVMTAVYAVPASTSAYSDSFTLQRIIANGAVTIGVRDDARPFSFVEKGEPQGYVVDLCHRIVNDIASQLGVSLKIRTVRVTPQNRLDLVDAGQVDMECGSTTVTHDRSNQVAFSLNTYVTNTRVLTRSEVQLDGSVNQFDALAGSAIAVVENTPHEQLLSSVMPGSKFQVIRVHDVDEGVRAVIKGKAKAFIQDDILLQTAKAAAGQDAKGLTISKSYLSVEPYSIAVVRGDPKFLSMINRSLRAQYADGYAESRLNYWFRERGLSVSKFAEDNLRWPTTAVAMHD